MRLSKPRNHRFQNRLSAALPVVVVCACLLSSVPHVRAQAAASVRQATAAAAAASRREIDERSRRAMQVVCAEREQDPQGSAPIDEMQEMPSLPLRHAEVLAGVERAERLLPVAKNLAAESLRALLREHEVKESNAIRAAFARLAQVRVVKPDMELRDNASVLYKEPRTIRFGTIFLAGLRSDEGMISVLAHELTHVADGASGGLNALFHGVAQKASRAVGLPRINLRRGEELTCDLVGARSVRVYISRTRSVETLSRRTARAIAHNCVERDHTDRAHLSPRTTMRALLALDPALAREITGEPPPPGDAVPTAATPARRNGRRAAHPVAPRTPRRR